MFVVNFNEKVTLGLPAAMPFTNRPDELAARDFEGARHGQDRALRRGRRGVRAIARRQPGEESPDRNQRRRRQRQRSTAWLRS